MSSSTRAFVAGFLTLSTKPGDRLKMRRPSFAPLLLLPVLLLNACSDSVEKSEHPAPTSTAATAPLPNAETLVKRLITQDGSKDITAEMRMTGEDPAGKRTQVDVRLQRKYAPGRASTFLTVLAPKEESDKAILALETDGQPTQAFSYLPGLKRIAKLNSERQLGFRGAKVTVQELLGLELGQYTHSESERVNESGQSLVKIEFKQKPDLALAFPRITGFFREDGQPVRFDLYDAGDQLQKRMTVEEVKTIQNRQTITRVAIEDLAQKLTLQLETRKIDYDRNLPDSLFTEERLKTVVTGNAQKLDQE